MSSERPFRDQRPIAGPPPPNYPRWAHQWPYVGRRRFCPFPRRALIAWLLAIVAFFGGGALLARCVNTRSAGQDTHAIVRIAASAPPASEPIVVPPSTHARPW
ncbi:MAG TPA: hypothetical protein VFR11_15545 [Micromonosporaceae bacterium]|jgi:hypothetical protein|nr:hypothetical protein [Micromonosporaceae bacterium]